MNTKESTDTKENTKEDTNIVYAFGSTSPDELQQTFINQLENALSDAKAGLINGLAIVETFKDGQVLSGWSAINNWALLGGITRLQYRISSSFDGETK